MITLKSDGNLEESLESSEKVTETQGIVGMPSGGIRPIRGDNLLRQPGPNPPPLGISLSPSFAQSLSASVTLPPLTLSISFLFQCGLALSLKLY